MKPTLPSFQLGKQYPEVPYLKLLPARILSWVVLGIILSTGVTSCTSDQKQTEDQSSPQENTPNQERIRFEVTPYKNSFDNSKPPSAENGSFNGDADASYPPFNTDCSSSEIEEYLSKSITGGEEANPFAREFSALLSCGSKAAPYLVQVLSTEDDHARFNATIALREMGAVANDEVVPALIKVIRSDQNPLVRAYAIKAIDSISPLTEEVSSALSEAKSDTTVIPGSDHNPRGDLVPVSEFAERTLTYTADRKSEYRDASCPVRIVSMPLNEGDYSQYYRLDRDSGQCVADGNDRPPGTGGDYIIKSFCSVFQCKSKQS